VLVDSVAVATGFATVPVPKQGDAVHCDEVALIAASRFFALSVSCVLVLPLVTSNTELAGAPVNELTNV
jgi:hypothetical protein